MVEGHRERSATYATTTGLIQSINALHRIGLAEAGAWTARANRLLILQMTHLCSPRNRDFGRPARDLTQNLCLPWPLQLSDFGQFSGGPSCRAKPIVLTGVAAMVGCFFIIDDPIFQVRAVSLIFDILVSTALTL